MPDGYSTTDLLDFLEHAGQKGLVPSATAQGLAVAARQVLSVLSDGEGDDVRKLDLDSTVHRFHNKRARDFSPGSLKTYEQRTRRAVDEFLTWRSDPANFRVRTRAPKRAALMESTSEQPQLPLLKSQEMAYWPHRAGGGYTTAFPLRPGHIVTVSNVPENLTATEAERLAQFVRMLAVEGR
jgi:hypothetical protein